MARPARAAGACGTERESDVAQVREQARGIDAVAADVEIALVSAFRAAVDRPIAAERLHRRRPEPLHMVVVPVAALRGELGRSAEADAQRRRQRPRAHSPLLPAAVDERRRLRAFAHPQGADTFGSVDLVRRQSDQVRPFRKRETAECLDGVGEHQGSAFVRHARDLAHRLDHPDLVIHEHHRDNRHPLIELAFEQVEVEHAVRSDR